MEELVERVASALERQVSQHDEQIARNVAWRDENVIRADRDRAENIAIREHELCELRETNADLMARLDQSVSGILNFRLELDALKARVSELERPLAADAVDPVVSAHGAADTGTPSTRD
jgi:hypothetical protein